MKTNNKNLKLERKFYWLVIILMIVSYYLVINKLQKEADSNFQLYKNMHGELIQSEVKSDSLTNQLIKCEAWINHLEND